MKIGILGTSDIAFRRFLPALKNIQGLEFAGIASRDISKTTKFTDIFGGTGYSGYNALLHDKNIDCVYIPLPPALHFEWGKKALEHNKHVFMEKPFTTTISDAELLVALAKSKNLSLHENYMFQYHDQIDRIKKVISSGEIGDVRIIRIDFGFPFLGSENFRYHSSLGGGALLDCGGYVLLLARMLLGEDVQIADSSLSYKSDFDVDICGSVVLRDKNGLTVQASFGIDNDYRCALDIWGSLGTLKAMRILTAPAGLAPSAVIRKNGKEEKLQLPADDTFMKSIQQFLLCIQNNTERESSYAAILERAKIHLSIKNFNSPSAERR